jgi:hypothetical protein
VHAFDTFAFPKLAAVSEDAIARYMWVTLRILRWAATYILEPFSCRSTCHYIAMAIWHDWVAHELTHPLVPQVLSGVSEATAQINFLGHKTHHWPLGPVPLLQPSHVVNWMIPNKALHATISEVDVHRDWLPLAAAADFEQEYQGRCAAVEGLGEEVGTSDANQPMHADKDAGTS